MMAPAATSPRTTKRGNEENGQVVNINTEVEKKIANGQPFRDTRTSDTTFQSVVECVQSDRRNMPRKSLWPIESVYSPRRLDRSGEYLMTNASPHRTGNTQPEIPEGESSDSTRCSLQTPEKCASPKSEAAGSSTNGLHKTCVEKSALRPPAPGKPASPCFFSESSAIHGRPRAGRATECITPLRRKSLPPTSSPSLTSKGKMNATNTDYEGACNNDNSGERLIIRSSSLSKIHQEDSMTVFEATPPRINNPGNVKNEPALNIPETRESKITNGQPFRDPETSAISLQNEMEWEESDRGNVSHESIGLVESIHVPPRLNTYDKSGEYFIENSIPPATNNKQTRSPIRALADSLSCTQQTPEKRASPKSETVVSPANGLHRMRVEMSPLQTPSPGQHRFADSAALQGRQRACSISKSSYSLQCGSLDTTPSQSCTSDGNKIASNIKYEGSENNKLTGEDLDFFSSPLSTLQQEDPVSSRLNQRRTFVTTISRVTGNSKPFHLIMPQVTVPEVTSSRINRGKMENGQVFPPTCESKITNGQIFRDPETSDKLPQNELEQEESDHGNTARQSIAPVESPHVSPRLVSSGGYFIENSILPGTDNIQPGSPMNTLCDFRSSLQQTPEKRTSPKSETVVSPPNDLDLTCVEISPIKTPSPAQSHFADYVSPLRRQRACFSPRTGYSHQWENPASTPFPRCTFYRKMTASDIKYEDSEDNHLTGEDLDFFCSPLSSLQQEDPVTVPEVTSSRIHRGNVENGQVLPPTCESQVANGESFRDPETSDKLPHNELEQEESDHGNTSRESIGPVESRRVSPRLARIFENVFKNSNPPGADNKQPENFIRALIDYINSAEEVPEKRSSPKSQTAISPANGDGKMSVEMSPLQTPSPGQHRFADFAAPQVTAPEATSPRITGGYVENGHVSNVPPTCDGKVISGQTFRDPETSDMPRHIELEGGESDHGNATRKSIGPVESPLVSPRLDRSGEYFIEYSIPPGADTTQPGSPMSTLFDFRSSSQQTPEKRASPKSETVVSPANGLHRMRVEMSPLEAPSPLQRRFEGYASPRGRQRACSTPKSHFSLQALASSAPQSCTFDSNMNTSDIKYEGSEHNISKEEMTLLCTSLSTVHQEDTETETLIEEQKEDSFINEECGQTYKQFEKVVHLLFDLKEETAEELQETVEHLKRVKNEYIDHTEKILAAKKDIKLRFEKSLRARVDMELIDSELIECLENCREALREREEGYESLKRRAAERLERCNENWASERQKQQAEINNLKSLLKKLDEMIAPREEVVAQKTKELVRIIEKLEEGIFGRRAPSPIRSTGSDEPDEPGIHE